MATLAEVAPAAERTNPALAAADSTNRRNVSSSLALDVLTGPGLGTAPLLREIGRCIDMTDAAAVAIASPRLRRLHHVVLAAAGRRLGRRHAAEASARSLTRELRQLGTNAQLILRCMLEETAEADVVGIVDYLVRLGVRLAPQEPLRSRAIAHDISIKSRVAVSDDRKRYLQSRARDVRRVCRRASST